MTLDFRTEHQKELDARNERIVKRYREIASAYPGEKPTRIIRQISKESGLGAYGIRMALIKGKAITVKTRAAI